VTKTKIHRQHYTILYFLYVNIFILYKSMRKIITTNSGEGLSLRQ